MSAGGVTRPQARGGGGLGSGDAKGASQRIDASQGRGYGKRAHVRHTCVYRGILAENLGHRHRSLFSYFDRQGFNQALLICPA